MRSKIVAFTGLVAVMFMIGRLVSGPGDSAKDLFAWFDGLGLPDLAHCKFIQISTGETVRESGQPARNTYYRAFLVKDDGPSFTVLTLSLETLTYVKTAPDKPEFEKVGYEPWDLQKEMTGLLKHYQQPPDEDAFPRRFGERISEGAELFVLARASAAQGHPGRANALLAQSRKCAAERNQDKDKPFPQLLADDIVHAMMWRAVGGFGRPAVTRKELLDKFSWIAKHFPRSPHAERASQTAALLKKMVAEDEEHASRRAKPAKVMSKRERIAELVFRLRDQNGEQWSQPGACDIFVHDRFGEKAEKSPAQQLVEIGYDAVPQLIEVLGDERFTRSVGFHRDFYFSHFVLRVGDCSVAVLERIAGRSFWTARTTSAAMLKDGQAPAAKKAVEAWWRDVQKKGEKAVLIEATKAGDDNSRAQAERLAEKYPDDALAAIRAGARRTEREWTRTSLVAIAGKLKGDTPVAFLREELKSPVPSARVAAAQGLLDRDLAEAVKAMIRDWEQNGNSGVRSDLISFLLWCSKEEAVQALAKRLRNRPIDVRLQVVEETDSGWDWADRKKTLPAPVNGAIDALLVEALDDREERTGMSGTRGGKQFSNPRICDLSGHILSVRWKQPSAFDLSGSLRTRDRQLVELRNVWLKKQGKTPVPLPEVKRVAPAPDGTVRPLLERLEAAQSDEQRQASRKALAALGLPALPAVRERLRALKRDQPAFASLSDLAVDLSCVVAEVRFAAQSFLPGEELRKLVETMKGRPLTPGQVVTLLTAVKDLAPPASGIKLAIDREGDDTGVVVEVRVTATKVRQEGTQKGWSVFETVSVGGQCVHNSSGGCSLEHGLTEEAWRRLAKEIRTALATPPETCLSIRAGIVRQE